MINLFLFTTTPFLILVRTIYFLFLFFFNLHGYFEFSIEIIIFFRFFKNRVEEKDDEKEDYKKR